MKPTKSCHCCSGTGLELDNTAFGAEMRKLRKSRNISLRQISKRMELSAPYLCDLERGRRNWNQELINRFEKACR